MAVPYDESYRCIAQCNIVPVRVSSTKDVAVLQELVPLFNMRAVGKMFRTVQVVKEAGKREEKGKSKKKAARAGRSKGEGGEVRLVMNEWMRGAWPHD